MLFLLIVLLLIAAGFTMMTKRNRESLFLMGVCCSLMVQFTGILIFIAKKGGYSKNLISFLFFSQTLRIKLPISVYHARYARLYHCHRTLSLPAVPAGECAAIFQ